MFGRWRTFVKISPETRRAAYPAHVLHHDLASDANAFKRPSACSLASWRSSAFQLATGNNTSTPLGSMPSAESASERREGFGGANSGGYLLHA